jgi:hypothetical protein
VTIASELRRMSHAKIRFSEDRKKYSDKKVKGREEEEEGAAPAVRRRVQCKEKQRQSEQQQCQMLPAAPTEEEPPRKGQREGRKEDPFSLTLSLPISKHKALNVGAAAGVPVTKGEREAWPKALIANG